MIVGNKKSRIVSLGSLPIGAKFDLVTLEIRYVNLEVSSRSVSKTYVKGNEILNGGHLKEITRDMVNSTLVREIP